MSSWTHEVESDLLARGRVLAWAKRVAPLAWRARKNDPATDAPRVMRAFRPPADVMARSVYVPRGDGTNLRLLVLSLVDGPKEAAGVLWLHGGGYVTGMPEMAYGGMPPHMLRERPCVVVCPDYRLASEMPFPGAVEDCHLALTWLYEHARELGVRSNQLFVGGESAGGGLTAGLCLYERDLLRAGRDGIRVACQMPLYPMLDDRATPSSAHNDAPVWDTELNTRAWDLYLAGMDREHVVPYAVPARETNYAGMPPAITFVGSLDPFLDETVAYVSALRRDGVDADLRVYRGCFHAFDLFSDSRQGGEARMYFLRHFATACDSYTS